MKFFNLDIITADPMTTPATKEEELQYINTMQKAVRNCTITEVLFEPGNMTRFVIDNTKQYPIIDYNMIRLLTQAQAARHIESQP